ncbi:MAG: hypothetical protein AAFV45_09990 [Pseudomonadota bacterium]
MSPRDTTKPDDDGFFVGYINSAPGSLRWFLPMVSVFLIGLFAGAGLLIGTGQNAQGAGQFLWGAGQQKLTGVIQAMPYPVLHARPTERFPEGRSIMLTGQGKRGVQRQAEALNGQVVDASGILLKRGDLDMLQVGKLTAAEADNVPSPVTREDLGRWRMTGEICDGKCVAGAMRPGRGLSHKACANLCLIGGAPPVFVATGMVEGQDFFLMGDTSGAPLTGRILDLVAQPVEIVGRIERRGDLLVVLINPARVKPL